MEKKNTAILLVNLGSPKSPHPFSVFQYLNEFLTDARVIDFPFWIRQLLVRGLIVPLRFLNTAKSYQAIWGEKSAPLLQYSEEVKDALQKRLPSCQVEIAMRYQQPSIKKAIASFKDKGFEEILVLPLYPQYSSACNGSVIEKVMDEIKGWPLLPRLVFTPPFYRHPAFIKAWAARGREKNLEAFDHILFSFHGLPERQIKKVAPQHCLQNKDCCLQQKPENTLCYRSHCVQTAHLVAQALQLPQERYSICFQSRLGKEPWLTPYTSEVLKEKSGSHKKILVFCPSFVCDCLETTFEIEEEYREEFLSWGGEQLELVTGLNNHPLWIDCLEQMIQENALFAPKPAASFHI